MRSYATTATVVLLIGGGLGIIEVPHAQPLPGQPVALVTARLIRADGTEAGASASFYSQLGQTTPSLLSAGSLIDGSLCVIAGADDGLSNLERAVREHAHAWLVTATPSTDADGKIAIDLAWSRFGNGNTQAEESRTARLSLLENQRHVLDLVHSSGASERCPVASVVLDVEARIHDDVKLADRLIQYDLWLVHTDPSGARQTRHVVTTGAHGTLVPYAFGDLRFPVLRLRPNQFDFQVVSRVAGQLRGRLDADGSIAVELIGGRTDTLESERGQAGGGREGRKTLRMRSGDAVEVELPTSGGISSQFATPEAAEAARGTTSRVRGIPARPASVPLPVTISDDGRLSVSYEQFFEGHRLALLIQARPLD